MRAFARSGGRRVPRVRRGLALLVALVVAAGLSMSGTASADESRPILGVFGVESLDGAGNNQAHPTWGMADTIYPRVAPARYADGLNTPVDGPNPRYVSNRVFSDNGQAVYSERGVSNWGWVWGQFLDHTFGLRLGGSRVPTDPQGQPANIPYDNADPLETLRNDFNSVFFNRSIPAPGTGVTGPREQVNLLNSYIDAYAVYGGTSQRLNWLRDGAGLFMPDNYMPRRDSRGDPASAPSMVVGGPLVATPNRAVVAGDIRANETIPLTAVHTLFNREHNRIVSQLPAWLSQQDKFQIARAVVIAEQQYVTYHEFLPALGVDLPRYTGYKRTVDTSLTNEFATIGYRAHSMVRSDLRVTAASSRYTAAQLDALRAQGVTAAVSGSTVNFTVPLPEDGFFNPDMLQTLQLGPVLQGIAQHPQSRNDELVTNMLRSQPFNIPLPGNPTAQGVNDLPAVDIERGRDHGLPTYNQLRVAYGLAPRTSFRAITGESSERFPSDPLLTPGHEIDDPHSLDFVALYDRQGHRTTPAADNATSVVRRTPLAARLEAIYHNVDAVDAFVGMVCEPHVRGSDFGELQLAMWRKEFTALRDGDRFFYGNNPLLPFVQHVLGIDYRKSLGDLIALNTDIPRRDLASDVFFTPDAQPGDGDAVGTGISAPATTPAHRPASERPAALTPAAATLTASTARRTRRRRMPVT